MKIKCIKCETIYNSGQLLCTKCSTQGGYAQEPSCKQIGTMNIHLEETLIHNDSKNEYQIKEIQAGGMLAVLTHSPIIPENARKGIRVYISNTNITEYTRK